MKKIITITKLSVSLCRDKVPSIKIIECEYFRNDARMKYLLRPMSRCILYWHDGRLCFDLYFRALFWKFTLFILS